MATKPRRLKTPMQLWIADNRKARGESPADLALVTGVSIDTARAWESRGRPSPDAVAALERHFGEAAPEETPALADLDALVVAIEGQTTAVTALVTALQSQLATAAIQETRLQALEAAVALLAQRGDAEPRAHAARREKVG